MVHKSLNKENKFSQIWVDIQSYLENEMKAVDQLIRLRLLSPVSLISEISQHLIWAGGKRIRPLLVLLTSKLVGYEGIRSINLAAAIEFIHTATLLHDDVVDESPQRRGIETAQTVWGNKASILVGDFLFTRAFECMIEDGSLHVLKILSRSSSLIAQGEVLQLETLHDLNMTESHYQEIIEAKTASLFEAACHIGAILGGIPSEECEDLKQYGRFLGILFQMTDDILDYKEAEGGKEKGIDFREGKVTLPVLLAYEKGNEEERAFWKRTFCEHQQRPDDFKKAQNYLERHHVFQDIQNKLLTLSITSKKMLEIFPDSEERKLLSNLVDFVLSRTF
ncbi:MAG: polyprenyl synthetase family protein [Proteobacteria bacterium]|nr:polyprenyl synthetase family protein [Pseudomonadota bacterium]